MKTKDYNSYITIHAESGYFLTNNNGIYGIEIVLGNNDSPENYEELPLSEWPESGTSSDIDITGTDVDFNYNENQYIIISSLEYEQQEKLKEIDRYDYSDNVNSFYYDGIKMWLDRETRAGLRNTIESFELVGRTELDIWYDNVRITLDLNSAKMLLAMLEVYATDCYNVTAQHKAAILEMTDIDDIKNFDITVGYPSKLEL